MQDTVQFTRAAVHATIFAAGFSMILFSTSASSAPLTCRDYPGASVQSGVATDRIRIAALDTPDGPAPCGKDGACNFAVCAQDPDCPDDLPGHVNHPSTTQTLTLNIEFSITKSAGADSTSRAAAIAKTAAWVAEAEKMFTRSPQLKIIPSYQFDTMDVPTSFKDLNEAAKFLKDHYDNTVGNSKTEGALVVAVTPTGFTLTHDPDDSCDDGGFGGMAFYPDSVRPLATKHGIVLSLTKADGSFAHELGHIFGLRHAFDRSSIFNKECNKDFPRTEGGTRDGTRINLMDHGLKDGDALWLNECQIDKAADHRKSLLTNDGKTNYRKL